MITEGRKPSNLHAGSSAADSLLPLSCRAPCKPSSLWCRETPFASVPSSRRGPAAFADRMISVLTLTLHDRWIQGWNDSQSRFLSLTYTPRNLFGVSRGSGGCPRRWRAAAQAGMLGPSLCSWTDLHGGFLAGPPRQLFCDWKEPGRSVKKVDRRRFFPFVKFFGRTQSLVVFVKLRAYACPSLRKS
jgi:hypothetical protein